MPRARTRQAPSEVLGRFARREPEVEGLIRESFLRGISTREVGEVLESILGCRPSAQTVSRITRSLDGEMRRFHWRGLSDDVRYLLLDGVAMTVKRPGGVGKKLLLVAYGIRPDGTRTLLDFRLALAESAPAWEAFLEGLFRRRLEGRNLSLIVTVVKRPMWPREDQPRVLCYPSHLPSRMFRGRESTMPASSHSSSRSGTDVDSFSNWPLGAPSWRCPERVVRGSSPGTKLKPR